MKKSLQLFVGVMMVITSTAFAQIPNAGFEDWSHITNGSSGYDEPDGWSNWNTMTAMFDEYTCMMGTPGSPGSSYLKLVTKDIVGMGIVPGLAVCGTIEDLNPAGGFPYTKRPTALTGKWQHMAYGSDEGYIAVTLTKWNSTTGMRETIGSVNHPLGSMVMSWQNFSIPINYTSSESPDSVMIILSSSGDNGVENSYLYVDNLGFSGVTGIEEKVITNALKLYPNPAYDALEIDLSAVHSPVTKVEIMNIQGKLVMQTQALPNGNLSIASLSPGQYILKVYGDQDVYINKFIKQ